ncbi:hypothetical protein PQQ65_32360 [Paraburkholderia strydomiana]|uniref:hypothetical protein n=1 Tax=Paraburkholderia strydomiana TaxID=1245417 RepID=UPI0038B91E5F
MTSKTMDLSEATAAARAGGIQSVTLKAQGAAFYLELETRQAGVATLVTTNGRKPRAFRRPEKAFVVVRDLGLDAGRFSLHGWRPDEADFERRARPDKSAFLKEAFAAGHDAWFRQAVLDSLRDDSEIYTHTDAIEALYSGFRSKLGDPDGPLPERHRESLAIEWRDMAFFDALAIGEAIAIDGGFNDPSCDEIDSQIAQLAKQHERGTPGRVDGTHELVIARTPYVAVYMITPVDPFGETGRADTKIQMVRLLHATKQQPKWDSKKRRV